MLQMTADSLRLGPEAEPKTEGSSIHHCRCVCQFRECVYDYLWSIIGEELSHICSKASNLHAVNGQDGVADLDPSAPKYSRQSKY